MRNLSKQLRQGLLISTAMVPAMLAGSAWAQSAAAPAVATAANDSSSLGEVVVTATRQAQALSKVPISVSAFTQTKMDQQGVKQLSDLVRLTPGLNFSQSNITANISIRGVASSAGAATTGVYIDDTPIQVRVVGTSSQNAYPSLFDLERVEVLRGPQGTLFGAGSEGGTIRFIQPQPSLDHYSSYIRAEGSTTQGGSGSYEVGGALGGPLVQDKLGFRASAFFRHDGGWISRESGSFTVLDPTGKAGPNGSLMFNPTGVTEANSNWQNTTVARVALTWKPTETLTITPSVTYQKIFQNDHIATFPVAASRYNQDQFITPAYLPVVDANHIAIPQTPANGTEPVNEFFILPTIHAEWEAGSVPLLGPMRVVSSSSFYYRTQNIVPDYTQLYETTYAKRSVALPGDKAISPATNHQQDYTQELRIQTDDPNARLNLVAGAFYTFNRQDSIQNSEPNFITGVSSISNTAIPGFPTPPSATNNGAPFGPGYSAYTNYYGEGLLNGVSSYFAHIYTHEIQEAVFGQADYKITDRLKATAGIRFSHDKVELVPDYNGPNSNLNAPHGIACLPGTGLPGENPCSPVAIGQYAPNTGPFVVAYEHATQQASENSVTPKFGISFQADNNNLYYATVSKGFRPGGAQQRQPSTCDFQLASLGYVDAAGNAQSPTLYNSDSLWSYEIGGKNKLFGGMLRLDSSAYLIKWNNIQTSISLSTCAQSFFDNLGSATGRGFDLQADLLPIHGLDIGVTVGYNKTTFDSSTVLGGKQLYTKGTALPNSPPPWTVVVSGQYDFEFNEHNLYARGDYTYTARQYATSATDPQSVSFDPMLAPTPSTSLFNARIGAKIGDADVSFFMNNVFDSHPHLNLTRTNGQPLYTDMTFRPRTSGVTIAYRY